MAKKTETAETQEKIETVSNAPAVIEHKGKMVPIEEVLNQVKNAEIGEEVGSDYFTLEPGEESRVIFLQMTEMNSMSGRPGEMTPAVHLLSAEDGRKKICADKVIVSVCRQFALKEEFNVPIIIKCTGKKKSAKGSYKEFEINKLIL